MANIRVRVGQRNGVKIIASNKSADFSITAAQDVDTASRSSNTLLMWDSVNSEYIHVTPADIADLVDGVDDDEVDFGQW